MKEFSDNPEPKIVFAHFGLDFKGFTTGNGGQGDLDCSRLGSLESSLSIEPQLAAGLVTGSGWGMQSAGAGSVGDKDEVYTYTLDTAANKPGGWSVSKLRFI